MPQATNKPSCCSQRGPCHVGSFISTAYFILLASILLLPSITFGQEPAKPAAAPEVIPIAPGTRIDGFRGIWFTLGQFSKHGDKYSGGLGTYTSSHNPLAVYSPEADKTFFTYGGTPTPEDRRLLIMVSCFDHKTGMVAKPWVVHDKLKVNDPHDNASLQLDDQGHVWVFVSGRGRSRPGFKYRSLEPYSIDRFELIQESEMTYPQPWYVPGHGWLNLITKYTKGRELYWESSEDGRTWGEPKKLAGMGGHYQVSGVHGTKIGTFFNYHPGGNVDKRTNLYYVQSTDFGKSWTTITGEVLEIPLQSHESKSMVIDYASQNLLQYACDINFDAKGNPILLYVTSRGYQPGPENDPREFTVSRWDGNAWKTSTVGKTDHNYDMGSIWVGEDVWKIIVPSEPGPQPYGSGGEMVLWASRDKGATWTKERVITEGSERNHNYARRPVNAHDSFYAFWADGNPDKFSPSRLYFCNATGESVWELPTDMTEDWATPILTAGGAGNRRGKIED